MGAVNESQIPQGWQFVFEEPRTINERQRHLCPRQRSMIYPRQCKTVVLCFTLISTSGTLRPIGPAGGNTASPHDAPAGRGRDINCLKGGYRALCVVNSHNKNAKELRIHSIIY